LLIGHDERRDELQHLDRIARSLAEDPVPLEQRHGDHLCEKSRRSREPSFQPSFGNREPGSPNSTATMSPLPRTSLMNSDCDWKPLEPLAAVARQP